MLRSERYLCNLPYISREEFDDACVEFADRSQRLGLDTTIVRTSDPVSQSSRLKIESLPLARRSCNVTKNTQCEFFK